MQSRNPIDSHMKIRALSLSYIVALVLIALLSISTYILLLNIIQQGRADAPLINMAGRQRMLSQKLVKEVLLLNQSQDPAYRRTMHQEIDQTIDTWTRVHNGLQRGDIQNGLSGRNSDASEKRYVSVNQHFNLISSALDRLLQTYDPQQPLTTSDSNMTEDIARIAERYLISMDQIVNQYEQEAESRVDRLRRTEAFVLASVLLLLAIEARFIFRPMIRQVRASFDKLLHANRELHQALTNVKILKGLLPICAACKKIRDDKGYWNQIEEYIDQHSEASFSHGICPDCARELYPELRPEQMDKDEKN